MTSDRKATGMTCHAKPRPRVPKGWECTGENLIILLWAPETAGGNLLPCVVPADRLDEAMAQPWAGSCDPKPFHGGDHLHLILGDQPGQ